MLEWTWLIPIIAFAVWVINNLQQRQREAAKQAGGAAPRPATQRPRSTSSEIDKFLEEINRRRQQQQQQQEQRPEPVSTRQPPPVRRAPPARSAERPRQQESKRQRRTREALAVEVVAAEVAAPEVLPATPFEDRPPPPGPPPAVVMRTTPPPHLVRLRELLASADGRRTAILLQEVFGPPRAKRGRGRG